MTRFGVLEILIRITMHIFFQINTCYSLAFPCSACSDCGSTYHADTAFIESDSSTFTKFTCDECKNRAYCSNKNCKLSVSYQEGSSWTAYQASDSTYLGGPHNDALDVNDAKKRVDEEENSVKVDGVLVGERPENAVDFRFKMIFGCQTRITGLFKTQLVSGHRAYFIYILKYNVETD